MERRTDTASGHENLSTYLDLHACGHYGRFDVGSGVNSPPLRQSVTARPAGMRQNFTAVYLRRIAISICSAMLCAISGCLPATTEAPGVTPVEGLWDLTGQGVSGSGSTAQGVLTIRSTSATAFAGSFDVLEVGGQGGQRRLSGPIGGRVASTRTVEFDVTLTGLTRRHVGTHSADTLRGSWFDVGAGGTVEASGSFRAVRR